jgi:hypothetical protein
MVQKYEPWSVAFSWSEDRANCDVLLYDTLCAPVRSASGLAATPISADTS